MPKIIVHTCNMRNWTWQRSIVFVIRVFPNDSEGYYGAVSGFADVMQATYPSRSTVKAGHICFDPFSCNLSNYLVFVSKRKKKYKCDDKHTRTRRVGRESLRILRQSTLQARIYIYTHLYCKHALIHSIHSVCITVKVHDQGYGCFR